MRSGVLPRGAPLHVLQALLGSGTLLGLDGCDVGDRATHSRESGLGRPLEILGESALPTSLFVCTVDCPGEFPPDDALSGLG
mmetsp:Transcript_51923/g.121520  ORF Transcript_51923/g.121520 Transcript_51923/m.121520 type:complete len:82 (+) Transcript_51923:592-837(+)